MVGEVKTLPRAQVQGSAPDFAPAGRDGVVQAWWCLAADHG